MNSAVLKISTKRTHNSFAARYDGDASEHYAKSTQLASIARSTSIFVAPQPLSLSSEKNCIQWQFLEDLTPIRTAFPLLSVEDQARVASQLGKTLAAIHAGLQLPGEKFSAGRMLKLVTNAELRTHCRRIIANSPNCNVHGDFACANIFLNRENEIVTLDPEPNIYLFDRASPSIHASIYVELGLLVQSLQSQPKFSRALNGQVETVSDLAITGYECQSGTAIDRPTIYALAAATMLIYRKYRFRIRTESWFDRFVEGRFRRHAARRLMKMAMRLDS